MKAMLEITNGIRLSRRGLTLVEVLVSIGVLGLLVAILIPAVQQARETARRAQCSNNLRQIILAYHEVQESTGRFPGFSGSFEGIWNIEILPYLEETKPFIDEKTGEWLSEPSPVATYACPSDPFARGTSGMQTSSYYPNVGRSEEHHDGFFQTSDFNPLRPADVTDGLSNTSALSEVLTLPPTTNPARREKRFADPIFFHRITRKISFFGDDIDKFAEACETKSDVPLTTIYFYSTYNHVQTPNRHSCFNRIRPPKIRDAVTATSLHWGGVNVAMGDGAVRFVSDSIDRNVWRALGSRNGGESIENSAF